MNGTMVLTCDNSSFRTHSEQRNSVLFSIRYSPLNTTSMNKEGTNAVPNTYLAVVDAL